MDLLTLAARLIVLFLGIPLHEWAHGYAAYLLGDDTPKLQGRLNLNPFTHLDPVGSLMILLTGWGWGRAAQVNPYWMHKAPNARVGFALSALAGPFSNFIQALLWALPFRLNLVHLLPDLWFETVVRFLLLAISINLGLMLFNLIPIPPLDGARILAGVAPDPIASFIESLEPVAPYLLMFVLFVLPRMGFNLVSALVGPAHGFLMGAIIGW